MMIKTSPINKKTISIMFLECLNKNKIDKAEILLEEITSLNAPVIIPKIMLSKDKAQGKR